MREIKFRAWSFHNKEMYQDDSPYPAAYSFQFYGNGNIGYCPTFDCDDLMSFYTDFDPETEKMKISVMQYTGLKDKNGKEIYEGDIMAWEQYEGTKRQCRWVVEINPFKPIKSWSTSGVDDAVIIGNIYENLDLLK